jgi:hypothetical protein
LRSVAVNHGAFKTAVHDGERAAKALGLITAHSLPLRADGVIH